MSQPDPLSWAPPARAYHAECRTCEVILSGVATGPGRKTEVAALVGIWGRRHHTHEQHPSEELIQQIIDEIRDYWAEGTREWTRWTRYDEGYADTYIRAVREAARRLGATIHVNIKPDDYDASVKQLEGTVVVRTSNLPPPWAGPPEPDSAIDTA